MIKYHRWNDFSYQLVLEKNSFYYANSTCVAFREQGSRQIYVKCDNSHLMDTYTSQLVTALSYSGKINYMKSDDFMRAADAIYAKSILKGIRRIGLDLLFCQNKPEGEKNVTDIKSDAG